MTSLITPPPNLLGVPVPLAGMLPTSIDNLLINGVAGWAENVGDSLTNLSISYDIDGTCTVIAQIEDPQRTLLRSALGLQRTVINIDGVCFVMADINKQGPQLTLTFEHVVQSALKDHTETVSVLSDTMSRTKFCEKLVGYEAWISCSLPGGPSPGHAVTMLYTGNVNPTTGGATPLPYSTTFTELQTFWDSILSTLGTIGWRAFPLGVNQLVMVSDQWLYTQPPIATIDEDTPGVQSIDFDWDIRKPLGQLTITCNASAWAFPIGSVIAFTPKMGIAGVQSDLSLRFTKNSQLPPANGHWLVTDVSRSLMSSLATITLDVPNLTMTEVQTQPPTSAAAQVGANYNSETGNDGGSAGTGPDTTAAFAAGVLAGISSQANSNNVETFEIWLDNEQDVDSWATDYTNPLGVGGAPIKQFATFQDAINATVQALLGNGGAYMGVVSAFRNNETQTNIAAEIVASPWNTGATTPVATVLSTGTAGGYGGLDEFLPPNHSPLIASAGTPSGSSNLLSIPGGIGGTNATPLVRAFVKFCLDHTTAASGCTYIYGDEGPTSFDCSGLVLAAAASIGVHFPEHNSDAEYTYAASHPGCAITVETGINTYGACLVLSQAKDEASGNGNGHIAVSLGGGQMVDAKGVAWGIITEPVPSGLFDEAFLLPGVSYT
jgi:hypothetical protein